MKSVYLTGSGAYLPNPPVGNDDMEDMLGLVAGKPSRYRRMVLRANGIQTRHYARLNGQQTHLNEELAALAVQQALQDRQWHIEDVHMLAAATTLPDVMMPGFGTMVHGRLGGKPLDVITTAGVCCASMSAFKTAVNSIRVGEHPNAVVVGSELLSPVMKGSRFESESELAKTREGAPESYQFFNADFLRWMLSDGAGAVVLESQPHASRPCLKLDWIEFRSYAHAFPTCMYMGVNSPQNLPVGSTFQSYDTYAQAEQDGLFVMRQDTKLLPVGLVGSVGVEAKRLRDKGLLIPEQVDHFLPHLSSHVFSSLMAETFASHGIHIPAQKWFTNLATKGNTGAASMFILLDEALRSGRFAVGDKVLCMVPESGRFSVSYLQFTVFSNAQPSTPQPESP
jgi:3-oxoacyl-[acyl-carrier-protein] synthase III